ISVRLGIVLIIVATTGGCRSMMPTNPTTEKARIEAVIKNSITWAQTKDKELLFRCFVDDSTLFYFSPDNAGTISGIAAFRQLVDDLFMNPAFRAVRAEFRDLHISLSRS